MFTITTNTFNHHPIGRYTPHIHPTLIQVTLIHSNISLGLPSTSFNYFDKNTNLKNQSTRMYNLYDHPCFNFHLSHSKCDHPVVDIGNIYFPLTTAIVIFLLIRKYENIFSQFMKILSIVIFLLIRKYETIYSPL